MLLLSETYRALSEEVNLIEKKHMSQKFLYFDMILKCLKFGINYLIIFSF